MLEGQRDRIDQGYKKITQVKRVFYSVITFSTVKTVDADCAINGD